jgi:hypothetical protein
MGRKSRFAGFDTLSLGAAPRWEGGGPALLDGLLPPPLFLAGGLCAPSGVSSADRGGRGGVRVRADEPPRRAAGGVCGVEELALQHYGQPEQARAEAGPVF